MKKIIILVVIILVVIGAAVGIYLWKKGQGDGGGGVIPQPKPKAGFEIYENTKHGFSLEYPEDWYLVDNSEFNSVFFSSKEEEAPMGGVSLGVRIEMFMIENSEGLELEKWIEQGRSQGPEEEIVKEEEITIGGEKAVKVVTTPRPGPVEAGPPITVYVAKDNYIIQINYTGRDTGLESDYFGNIENLEYFLTSFKKEKISELTLLDETWNLYTNHKLGFSIKVPKEVLHEYGTCEWKDDSYRSVAEFVPVKVFENEKIYISTEYYYEPTGRTVKPEGGVTFSGCDKVTNTLTLLGDRENFYQRRWGIVIETVKNDKELDEFIKEQYGSGCALDEKKLSKQEGVYDVTATGEPPACFINYASTLKYYPEKNKVAYWGRGQDVTFWGDKNHTVVYDGEIVDSFRFK